jgi:transcriptional regulator with XRE-family HTH domain
MDRARLHDMERFRDELKARQATETDSDFAARLGMSQGYWTRVKNGQRPLTIPVAVRAIALWPELRAVYLAEVEADLDAMLAQLRTTGTPNDSAGP